VDELQHWRRLIEETGPRLLLPVGVALVVTLLWLLTGWAWFDVGPWPWALGALPVAILEALRLWRAQEHRSRAWQALDDLAAALARVGRSTPAAERGPIRTALRLCRTRLGGAGLQDLGDLLDDTRRAAVRDAADPLETALRQAAEAGATQASLDAVRDAVRRCDALGRPPAPDPLAGLPSLYLATLPVGLVTLAGVWTALAVGGVALAFGALGARADRLARPFGPGRDALPVDDVLDRVDRDLADRAGV
jgi:hypothetical protein